MVFFVRTRLIVEEMNYVNLSFSCIPFVQLTFLILEC